MKARQMDGMEKRGGWGEKRKEGRDGKGGKEKGREREDRGGKGREGKGKSEGLVFTQGCVLQGRYFRRPLDSTQHSLGLFSVFLCFAETFEFDVALLLTFA